MWIVLIVGVQVLWAVAMLRLSIGIADGLPHLWLRLVPALQAIALTGLFVLLFRSRRRKVYRELAEFRQAPWCLKCRYPTPQAATICPECGEPIPPEIAGLAAERAGVGGG